MNDDIINIALNNALEVATQSSATLDLLIMSDKNFERYILALMSGDKDLLSTISLGDKIKYDEVFCALGTSTYIIRTIVNGAGINKDNFEEHLKKFFNEKNEKGWRES